MEYKYMNRIIIYSLVIILAIGVWQLCKFANSFDIPVIKDVQVMPKYVTKIVVKGTVKKEPYVIVLKNTDKQAMDFTFDYEASQIPKDMYVDSVDTITKYDYLAPIRLGYGIINTGEYKPTIAYNPIRYKSLIFFEMGIITDFKGVGVDLGIKYRNVGLNVFYEANKTYGVGLMVKLF